VLVVLAGAVAVFAAASAGLRWAPLAQGGAEPSGAQAPLGYFARSRREESAWIARVQAAQRARVAGADFSRRVVVSAFLDGRPCARDVAVTAVRRTAGTLTVDVAYTRPPIGVATCVRTSTAYVVLTIARSSFGGSLPARVQVAARARA
jgi:hypothetical protein